MGKSRRKFYAVAKGRQTGIFDSWAECEKQVKKFSGASYKSFTSQEEAEAFIREKSAAPEVKNAEAAKALHMEQDGNGLEKQGAQIYNSQKRKKYASKETESETFESSPREKKRKRMESASVQSSLKISIMFDGGSRGNPGIGGAGALVTITSKTDGSSTDFETRKIRVRHYLGRSTNNEAEYCGLCQGLETVLREVKQLKSSSKDIKEPSAVDTKLKVDLIVQGDSQLVIKQIKKEYKCNQPSLRVYLAKVRSLIDEIGQFCELKADFEHVLREFNSVADGLANQAMDAQRSWITEDEA